MNSQDFTSKLFRFHDHSQASGFAAFAGWTAASMGFRIDVVRKGWSALITLQDFSGSTADADRYFVALDQSPPAAFFQEMTIGG